MNVSNKAFAAIAVSAALSLLAFAGSLLLGKYPVGARELYCVLTGYGAGDMDPARLAVLSQVVFSIRLPRALAALLVGASLATSGAAYQSMFRNPLVSPGILGVLAGAGFGAALGIVLNLNWAGIQAMSFAWGLAAVAVSLALAKACRGDKLIMLILGGIISGALFTALLSFVKYVADPNDQLPAITYWLMGSLSLARAKDIWLALPLFAAGMLALLLSGKALNALSLGDDEASALGVDAKRLRVLMVLAATAISVSAVALAGIIGWIGLIVPHLGRLLVGPDNRLLLPVSGILGAFLLLLADDLSRSSFPAEIPLGITTSLFGIPLFAIILIRARGASR